MKSKLPLAELCEGLPECFLEYMQYVRELPFERAPGYKLMTNIFK
jgi:hypothetical protein